MLTLPFLCDNNNNIINFFLAHCVENCSNVITMDDYFLWVVGSMLCIVVSYAATTRELFRTNDAIFCGRPQKLI